VRGRGRRGALTRQLIDAPAADWDPTRYRDTYRDVLLKVIEQKAPSRRTEARGVSGAGNLPSVVDAVRLVQLELQLLADVTSGAALGLGRLSPAGREIPHATLAGTRLGLAAALLRLHGVPSFGIE
jgi:hypothetical protein